MKPIKSDRFVCTEISGGALDAVQVRVLVDRKTGVNYVWTAAGYAGGLTVLLDAEGKPVVTPIPPPRMIRRSEAARGVTADRKGVSNVNAFETPFSFRLRL